MAVQVVTVDLANFKSIKACALEMSNRFPTLNSLILNAGECTFSVPGPLSLRDTDHPLYVQ